jgi:hypothetical protein
MTMACKWGSGLIVKDVTGWQKEAQVCCIWRSTCTVTSFVHVCSDEFCLPQR